MHAVYRASDAARPVFDYAFRWLEERLPADPPTPRLVHGDFRNGNLIIDENGIAAVLDWEIAHIGDPIEDLGWLCVPSWRFGALDNAGASVTATSPLDQAAGGFGPLDALLDGYGSAGGDPVDPDRLHFWMVLGTLYWGQCCMTFMEDFRRGDRAVERASIGRRMSEAELDILMLTDPGRGRPV